MGQPDWDHVADRTDSIMLSPRQRDWLASVSDDTVAELLEQEDDGGLDLILWVEGEADERVTTIPWVGVLGQPVVRLANAEQDVHDLPETEERHD